MKVTFECYFNQFSNNKIPLSSFYKQVFYYATTLKDIIDVKPSHLKMQYDGYSPLIFFPLSWSQCFLLFQVFYDSILFHNNL